jgi:hypothetical protein
MWFDAGYPASPHLLVHNPLGTAVWTQGFYHAPIRKHHFRFQLQLVVAQKQSHFRPWLRLLQQQVAGQWQRQ